jgi:hypothetical protein
MKTQRIEARLRETAGLHPWAKEMEVILKKIAPRINTGFSGMGSSDGEAGPLKDCEKMIDAFTKAGYKIKGKLNPKKNDEDNLVTIFSKKDKTKGIYIIGEDPNNPDDPPRSCSIYWFDEEYD